MSQANPAIFLCRSEELVEGGKGVRFPLTASGEDRTGFAIRYDGIAYAYVNRCAHVPVELDWMEGEFFDTSGLYLMCATHGAIYAPDTGRCEGGPCRGGGLRPIRVLETDGTVFWEPDDDVRPALA